MYISSVLLVSIVALGVTCIPWGGPKETPVRREGDGVGWSPVPTPEPRSFFDSIALWKRQGYSLITTTGTTYSSYSYATCGFLSGSTSIPFTCYSQSYSCAVDGVNSVFGCCLTPSACQMATACVPQLQISSCIASSACVGDPYITKCDVDYQYCNQYILDDHVGSATYWYCGSAPTVRYVDIAATDGLKRTATYVNVTMNIKRPTTSSILSSTSPTLTSSSSLSQTISTSRTTISTSTSTSTSPTPTPTSLPSPTPIGAIVGGTLGGIALIGALVVLAIFLLRRKRPTDHPSMQPQSMSSMPPFNPGPVGSSSYSHQQQQQYNTHATAPACIPQEEKIVYTSQTTPLPRQATQSPIYATGPISTNPGHQYLNRAEIAGDSVHTNVSPVIPGSTSPGAPQDYRGSTGTAHNYSPHQMQASFADSGPVYNAPTATTYQAYHG